MKPAQTEELRPEGAEPGETPGSADREWFTLIDFLIVLAKHKRWIIGLPLFVAIVAALVSFLIPPTFTATAKILPPQQTQSPATAMLGQLGALAGVGGRDLGLKGSSDIYVAMLKSRKVADAIIGKFDLQKHYGAKLMVDARRSLEGATSIVAAKDGIISIEVSNENPKFAATLANAYVDELYIFNQKLALTEASQRRLFFEKQLEQAKEGMTNAEIALRGIQEKSGIIKLEEQGRAIIEAIGRAKGQVAAKEVQLVAMRTFLAEGSPELLLAQQELGALRSQLAKLEQRENRARGDVFVPTQNVPELGMEYLRGFREVKYHETLFELLAKQYELARIDEAKNASLIQVLEEAVEPERRSKPHRKFMVIVAAAIALVVAVLTALVLEAVAKAAQDPTFTERLRFFRRNLRWR